jgi:hypothetical protein
MWLQTTCGFFSIVEKPEDRGAGTLTVRARVEKDLEDLKAQYMPELTPINTSGDTDYRYRAKGPKAAVSAGIGRAVAGIDYSNFKNAVASRQGQARAAVYHEVWDTLLELQLGEAGDPLRSRQGQ